MEPAPLWQSGLLFDYIVRDGEQRRPDIDTKCFRSSEINREIHLCGLLNWKFCGLLAFKNSTGVDPCELVGLRRPGRVAHQSAARNIFLPWIDDGQTMLCS